MVLSGSFPSLTRIVGLATACRACLAPRACVGRARVVIIVVVVIVAIALRSSSSRGGARVE
jgi:hypothetical protein